MQTFKNFKSAILEMSDITVNNGQISRGYFAPENETYDYQLVNNRCDACTNLEITPNIWRVIVPLRILENDLNNNRTRRVLVSNQIHTIREMKMKRFRGRTPSSFIMKPVEVTKATSGVAYFGDYVLTDYTIIDDQTAETVWTNVNDL